MLCKIKIEKVRYVLTISTSFTISIFFVILLGLKDMIPYFIFYLWSLFYYFIKNDIVKSSSNQELIIIICLISIFPPQ